MSTILCSPPAARVAAPDTDGVIEVTLSRALKVWWSLYWRQNLYSLPIAFVCGVMIGIIGAAAGMSMETLRPLCYLSGAVVAALVGIEVTWIVLRKSWADFRIVLVPNHPRESPDPQ